MIRPTYRKQPPWTEADDQFLVDNFNQLPEREIANHLGRTVDAVKKRRFTLRFQGRIEGRENIKAVKTSKWFPPPTLEQIAERSALVRKNWTDEQLVERLA